MKILSQIKFRTFLTMSFLLFIATANISAARYITIATIGTSPSLDRNQEPQKLVDQVIEFWKRELKQVLPDKPDLILFSSMYHGGLVQGNWAYTCRSFFVGSLYRGTPSEIRNPLGEVIASNTNYFNYAVARVNLDCELVHLDFNRSRMNALKEKYGPAVNISDPGKLGAVLVTSEHETIGVSQMIKEFEIELLDNYFTRSREFRLREGNIK